MCIRDSDKVELSNLQRQIIHNTDNIAIGHDAFFSSVDDGNRNIAIGFEAIKNGDVSGESNIGIGTGVLDDLTSGADNIAIGSGAAIKVTTNVPTIALPIPPPSKPGGGGSSVNKLMLIFEAPLSNT